MTEMTLTQLMSLIKEGWRPRCWVPTFERYMTLQKGETKEVLSRMVKDYDTEPMFSVKKDHFDGSLYISHVVH